MTELLAMQRGLARRRDIGVDSALEVAVEVFIGIELGRIGRQIEDCDGFAVLPDPLADRRGVVDIEIAEDPVDLPLGVANQARMKVMRVVVVSGPLKIMKRTFP